MPSSTQSFKYLYGNAFRAPNAYELNTYYFGAQVEDLQPELIGTHEFVWERYVNDWLRTSTSAYWYEANRLITLIPDASTFLGSSYVNHEEVRARGLEFEAQMRLSGGAQAIVSYALQNTEDIDEDPLPRLPNSPRHMAQARLTARGLSPRSSVSVDGQYLSSRETLTGAMVSAATTFDVTMVQPLGHSWEIFGGVRNIFDNQYADPVSSVHLQDSVSQNGRTARIGLRWRSGTKSQTTP